MQNDGVGGAIGIHERTIGECWIASVSHVLKHGQPHYDLNIEMFEVLGLSVEISEPSVQDPLLTAHGDMTVLSRTIAKFEQDADMPERPFTYGQRVFNMEGVNQFEWMVDRLQSKPDTKSATINLLIPGSTAASIPCLTTIDAKIRRGRLDVQFFFRSQNIFGRQYANLAALAKFQSDLAHRCNIVSGTLRGYIASAHIYGFDMGEARELVAGAPIRIADRYYQFGPQSTGA